MCTSTVRAALSKHSVVLHPRGIIMDGWTSCPKNRKPELKVRSVLV